MTPSAETVFQAAFSLPPDDRAALAERLLESLEEKDRGEIDAAWAEEAERRLQAFVEGKVKAIPAEEILRPHLFGTKQ